MTREIVIDQRENKTRDIDGAGENSIGLIKDSYGSILNKKNFGMSMYGVRSISSKFVPFQYTLNYQDFKIAFSVYAQGHKAASEQVVENFVDMTQAGSGTTLLESDNKPNNKGSDVEGGKGGKGRGEGKGGSKNKSSKEDKWSRKYNVNNSSRPILSVDLMKALKNLTGWGPDELLSVPGFQLTLGADILKTKANNLTNTNIRSGDINITKNTKASKLLNKINNDSNKVSGDGVNQDFFTLKLGMSADLVRFYNTDHSIWRIIRLFFEVNNPALHNALVQGEYNKKAAKLVASISLEISVGKQVLEKFIRQKELITEITKDVEAIENIAEDGRNSVEQLKNQRQRRKTEIYKKKKKFKGMVRKGESYLKEAVELQRRKEYTHIFSSKQAQEVVDVMEKEMLRGVSPSEFPFYKDHVEFKEYLVEIENDIKFGQKNVSRLKSLHSYKVESYDRIIKRNKASNVSSATISKMKQETAEILKDYRLGINKKIKEFYEISEGVTGPIGKILRKKWAIVLSKLLARLSLVMDVLDAFVLVVAAYVGWDRLTNVFNGDTISSYDLLLEKIRGQNKTEDRDEKKESDSWKRAKDLYEKIYDNNNDNVDGIKSREEFDEFMRITEGLTEEEYWSMLIAFESDGVEIDDLLDTTKNLLNDIRSGKVISFEGAAGELEKKQLNKDGSKQEGSENKAADNNGGSGYDVIVDDKNNSGSEGEVLNTFSGKVPPDVTPDKGWSGRYFVHHDDLKKLEIKGSEVRLTAKAIYKGKEVNYSNLMAKVVDTTKYTGELKSRGEMVSARYMRLEVARDQYFTLDKQSRYFRKGLKIILVLKILDAE